MKGKKAKRGTVPPARYYVVFNKANPDEKCLVEANHPTQALSYAAQHFAEARIATVVEAVNMQKDGYPVVRWSGKPEQGDIEQVTGSPPQPTTLDDGAPLRHGVYIGGPVKCDGNHAGPPCEDPECWQAFQEVPDPQFVPPAKPDGPVFICSELPAPRSAGATSRSAPAPAGAAAPAKLEGGTAIPPTASATPTAEQARKRVQPKGMMASEIFGKGFTRDNDE